MDRRQSGAAKVRHNVPHEFLTLKSSSETPVQERCGAGSASITLKGGEDYAQKELDKYWHPLSLEFGSSRR